MQEGTASCCNSLPRLLAPAVAAWFGKEPLSVWTPKLSDDHFSLLSSSPSFPCNTSPIATRGIA